MPKISATIITLNEEKNLPRCLESLKGWTDEVIVVDSGSTDNTLKIAEKYGAKVYFRRFDNYATQKNYAASKSCGDWIFSIDADEVSSPELAQEIKTKLHNVNTEIQAFSIPRKNIIFGKLIKHSRWQPELDRHIWLWKKGFGKWKGYVHEELVTDGETGRLKNAKIHYQYNSIKEFFEMIINYSGKEADEKVQSGTRYSVIQLIGQPLYNFLVRYFYRLGFLDGWRGFVLSYLMAFYHFILWIEVWHKNNSSQ